MIDINPAANDLLAFLHKACLLALLACERGVTVAARVLEGADVACTCLCCDVGLEDSAGDANDHFGTSRQV